MGMDVYGKDPSSECGQYFRANIWSWRPILDQIVATCRDLVDDELLEAMAYNDGAGPDDQVTCDEMADRLEEVLVLQPEGFSVESDLIVDEQGRLQSKDTVEENPTGNHRPAYFAASEHVRQWIEFLRHCGGFEVF